MNRVVVYSNWCYVDQLDGKTLENGEKLRVRWPDGKETQETVFTMDKSYDTMDHASPYRVPVIEAYVTSSIHGASCLVRLTKDDILCERV